MVHRIREKGKKRSIFDKVKEIKNNLKLFLPELEEDRIIPILARCRRFYEGSLYYGRKTTNIEEKKNRKKQELTEIEKVVYQFLIEQKLNPSTTYRWFLHSRVPEDIKEKLEKNLIPVRLAVQISNNRKKIEESNQGLLLLEEMRQIVRGL